MGPTEGAREAAARARWESLYRRFHRPLVAYVEQLTDDPDSAEDIAHETFVAAIVQFKAGAGRPSWPWLRGLATRLSVTTTEDSFAVPAGLPVLGAATPEPHPEDEPAGEVAAAFAALPPRERLVLTLRFQEGWTQAEIGRLLKIESGTVQALIGRAKRRLQLEVRRIRGGDFGVVGWVAAARLRAYDVLARMPVPSGEELALAWRALLERLQPAVGVLATSAAALSLTTVLATLASDVPSAGRYEAGPAPMYQAASASDARPVTMPGDEPAEDHLPTAPRSLPAIPTSGGIDRPTADPTQHRVEPVSVEAPREEPARQEFKVTAWVTFECPPPSQRPPTRALGCPVLEAASPLVAPASP